MVVSVKIVTFSTILLNKIFNSAELNVHIAMMQTNDDLIRERLHPQHTTVN